MEGNGCDWGRVLLSDRTPGRGATWTGCCVSGRPRGSGPHCVQPVTQSDLPFPKPGAASAEG